VVLTGNYTFFNLLAVTLCVLCLDDEFWQHVIPRRIYVRCRALTDNLRPAPHAQHLAAAALATFAFGYTALEALPILFRATGSVPGFGAIVERVAPFRSLNTYGLFAVMTNPRFELIFEGSNDGREWKAYEFPHKPGDLMRPPTWVAPHQPRLDWQLWFAALGSAAENRWVYSLCDHLLRGTPEILRLFSHNPFPDKPPQSVRVVRYEYHFTDRATRKRTGQWWRRSPIEYYIPATSIR
jgi:lipase maturation factor 1